MLKTIGGMVMAATAENGPTAPAKATTLAEVVKKATAGAAGKAAEVEDGLVMETKLKIIEILQVGRVLWLAKTAKSLSVWQQLRSYLLLFDSWIVDDYLVGSSVPLWNVINMD